MQAERKKADPETIDRRRQSRRWKSRVKQDPHYPAQNYRTARIESSVRDHEVAVRLCRRFFRGEEPDALAFDIRNDLRYWQARRCGWDVMSKEVRTIGRDAKDEPILCDPRDTRIWRWWRSLHYEERLDMVRASTIRLICT